MLQSFKQYLSPMFQEAVKPCSTTDVEGTSVQSQVDQNTDTTPEVPYSSADLNFHSAKDWSLAAFKRAFKTTGDAAKQVAAKAKDIDVVSIVSKAPLLREFQKAQEEFDNERITYEKCSEEYAKLDPDSALPPWHADVARISDPEALKSLRERILSLSLQTSTFLVSPPIEAQFDWSPERSSAMMNVAKLMLTEDKNLASMRFSIVPRKIKEDTFWRNYFYRVSLIRQSAQLSALANTPVDEGHSPTANDFVCVSEQDIVWESEDIGDTSLDPSSKVQETVPNTDTTSSPLPAKDDNLEPPKHETARRRRNEASSKRDRVSKPSTKPKKSLTPEDEELEAELSREVDELVLTEADSAIIARHSKGKGVSSTAGVSSVVDDMEKELELEILAELENEKM